MSTVNFDHDVCAMTDTGLVRDHNEDSNRVENTHNGALLVVCDGMGGHAGGATASRIAVDSICHYASQHECDVPQQFLVKAIEHANEQVYAQACDNPALRGMGTTVCAALVRGNKVWYAHVGDSRIYYFNHQNNALYRLTKDHSVVQALVDQGMITEAEAKHHPERNKIRRSLGIKPVVEVEPCQMPLLPADGDLLLLCSDGLSGMIDDDDMLEVLSTTHDINQAGKALVDLAKAAGGTDNITVQLVRMSGMERSEAVFDAKNGGVKAGRATAAQPAGRRVWPWIVIAASAVLIALMALLALTGTDSKTADNVATTTTATAVKTVKAYQNEIPTDAEVVTFVNPDEGVEYQFYRRPGNPEGDLLVNLGTECYETGQFEYLAPKKIYQAIPGKVKRYKADGTPRQ